MCWVPAQHAIFDPLVAASVTVAFFEYYNKSTGDRQVISIEDIYNQDINFLFGSPTIVSQLHSFFIHRLANDRDLHLFDTTISTLDALSRSLIPGLSQGCCVVTGMAFELPMVIQVDCLPSHKQPASEGVDLERLWRLTEKQATWPISPSRSPPLEMNCTCIGPKTMTTISFFHERTQAALVMVLIEPSPHR